MKFEQPATTRYMSLPYIALSTESVDIATFFCSEDKKRFVGTQDNDAFGEATSHLIREHGKGKSSDDLVYCMDKTSRYHLVFFSEDMPEESLADLIVTFDLENTKEIREKHRGADFDGQNICALCVAGVEPEP